MDLCAFSGDGFARGEMKGVLLPLQNAHYARLEASNILKACLVYCAV